MKEHFEFVNCRQQLVSNFAKVWVFEALLLHLPFHRSLAVWVYVHIMAIS